jgi:hypothetical protein
MLAAAFGSEFFARAAKNLVARARELVEAPVLLASEAASLVNGKRLVTDGGFLASRVIQ